MQSVIDELDEDTLLDHNVQTEEKNRGSYKHHSVRFAYRAAAGLHPRHCCWRRHRRGDAEGQGGKHSTSTT